MPVGTGGHGEGHVPGDGAGDRRRHHPRQHLSSDAAARRRAHRASSAACTNSCTGTGPILTDSGGYQVMSLAKLRTHRRARRDLPVAYRRRDHRADARARDRDAMPARRRHPDGARRMHAVSGDARRGERPRSTVDALGRAHQGRVRQRAPRRARRCSASCRAASIPTCASGAPAR